MTSSGPVGELFGTSIRDHVEIVEYDEEWPVRFASLKTEIERRIGPAVVRIDHVGSTAVPGLASKPVIDVQVAVADLADEASYRPALEGMGLVLRYREPGWLYFRPPSAPRTHHVHVTQAGGERERTQLAFVDYLRRHPERRDAYAALKRDLAMQYRTQRLEYTEAKGEFIRETLALAEASQSEGPRERDQSAAGVRP